MYKAGVTCRRHRRLPTVVHRVRCCTARVNNTGRGGAGIRGVSAGAIRRRCGVARTCPTTRPLGPAGEGVSALPAAVYALPCTQGATWFALYSTVPSEPAFLHQRSRGAQRHPQHHPRRSWPGGTRRVPTPPCIQPVCCIFAQHLPMLDTQGGWGQGSARRSVANATSAGKQRKEILLPTTQAWFTW